MTPFLLLVFCLGSLNVVRWLGSQPEAVEVAVTTAVSPPTATPHPPTPNPTHTTIPPTLTPTPPPTATPYSPPIYTDTIHLLGPPPDSAFAAATTISFYWQWPRPLAEDQFFAVYLLSGDEPLLMGTVQEPNIGTSYRLHVDMAAVETTAVSSHWQVHLATIYTDEPLQVSEIRPFTLLTP